MRILVVDDDALAGELTGAVLEGLGHEVRLASDGLDAVEQLDADAGIGLIVSDMNMPLMSGVELFRELRGQGCALPFILLSGDDPDTLRAAEPRLDACLPKDAELERTLPPVIERLCGGEA